MFNLHFTNNFSQPITINEQTVIPANGGTLTTGMFAGDFLLTAPGINKFTLLDLDNSKIDGYDLPGTKGILIRYEGVEVYSRFDGLGEYKIVFDRFGDVSVETVNGNSLLIQLPGLRLIK